MNREKSIVFRIPFNNLDPLGKQKIALTEEWIQKRMKLFMNYTLPSLRSQTSQEFRAYVLYDERSESFIFKHLATYHKLPSHIVFIPSEQYDSKVCDYIRGSKYFYEIELGSDDMYHRGFVAKMSAYQHRPETVILICQDGYIYSSVTGELAEYFNFSSFFNCWTYNTQEYLAGLRRQYPGFTGAVGLRHEKIAWRAYINHSHDSNVAFSYELEKTAPWGVQRAHLGRTITDQAERIGILSSFGIIENSK
ncbi:MAG: glycosyltransferase [Cellulosilyticaceae bacterium]